MIRRLRLRRKDGVVYLNRWGISVPHVGSVLLHRMEGPDPRPDLHDHPWTFVSLVLWGGYTEQRADTRDAPMFARTAEEFPGACHRGGDEERRVGSVRMMRLDECHTITRLNRRTSWSLLLTGPRRRKWGYYLPAGPYRRHDNPPQGPGGWMRHDIYKDLVGSGLVEEIHRKPQ